LFEAASGGLRDAATHRCTAALEVLLLQPRTGVAAVAVATDVSAAATETAATSGAAVATGVAVWAAVVGAIATSLSAAAPLVLEALTFDLRSADERVVPVRYHVKADPLLTRIWVFATRCHGSQPLSAPSWPNTSDKRPHLGAHWHAALSTAHSLPEAW
jgi:hypothetical protein